jgi:hypothetical protein
VIRVPVHLHQARQWTGWILGAVAMAPFAFCFDAPVTVSRTVPVTGRVTYLGRPLGDLIICLDKDGEHSACAMLQADGSFRLININCGDEGAVPGRYRAHLAAHLAGSTFPSRYGDTATSGMELVIGPGWNEVRIDL